MEQINIACLLGIAYLYAKMLLGFVYFEGDCFTSVRNPYIPLDVDNPTLAQVGQKQLTGEGVEKRREVVKGVAKFFRTLAWHGEHISLEEDVWETFYKHLCEEIIKERRRIGGDWVVASAVIRNKKWRQYVR